MKKLLSLVLALLMVLGCMSIPAFAATPVETPLITDSESDGIAAHTDTGLKLIGDREAVYDTDYAVYNNGEASGKTVWHIEILTSGWKIAGTVSNAFANRLISVDIKNQNDVEGFTVTVGDLSTASTDSLIQLYVSSGESNSATVVLDTAKALWLDVLAVGDPDNVETIIVGNGKEIDTPSLNMANVCLDNVTVKAESATSFAALCMGELSLTNGAKLIAISTADSRAYGLYGMTSVSASADSEIFLSGKDGAVCGFSAADPAFVNGWKASAEVVDYANKGTMTDTAAAASEKVDNYYFSIIKDSSPVTVAKTVYNEATPTGGDNEEESKSGSTDITAIREVQPVAYEIVIPDAVTMTKAGVVEIGAATIKTEKLKNATANTVISYTASGTDFALSTNASKTVPATYYTAYTDENTNTVLGTAPIVVYQNNALVNPLTKLHVGVSEADWNAAVPGTYTATVTFDFTAEEKEPECEVNLNTYTELYKVVKIDDAKVYVATYTYESDSFVLNSYSLADLPKDTFESSFGTTYAVGDCYHTDGQTLEKCALPESHGLSSNEIVFTYKTASVQTPVTPFAVPEGTTYEIRGNQLYISCSDNPISNPHDGKQYTFTLNGANLSDGATDTISDGDAFVGTEIEKGPN